MNAIGQVRSDGGITKARTVPGKKTLGQSCRTSVRYWLRIGAAALKNGDRTRGITSQTLMTRTEDDWSSN